MLRVAILRVALLVGVAVGVLAVEPEHENLPVLLALCLLGAVVVTTLDRRAVLEAGVAASLALAAAFSAVLDPTPPRPASTVVARPERPRRTVTRKRHRPDVAIRLQPRAPGRA